MAKAKASSLFDMGTADLQDQLRNSQQQLLTLRFQLKTHQNENYARIRELKRDIARAKTILHERELMEVEA